jgi:hypothetical protein
MNRRSFLLSLLSVIAAAVIPPCLWRFAAAQSAASDVIPQQDECGSRTISSICREQQNLAKKSLESDPLGNLRGDPYYVTLRPGTGRSHFLKCYILMVYAQRSQLRNFRHLARSHGYSVSTSLCRSLAAKDLPRFSSHGFPEYFGSFALQPKKT